jgi:TetR/AcrR family transcriptional regulator
VSQKDQIAEAFDRHLARYGYSKTTLDEIAREMHISKKTIYTHFDSKADIYAYIVEGVAAAEKTKLAAAVATLPTYAARIEALMKYVMESARAHIEETTEADWAQELEVAQDAFRKANGDLIRELVQAGMDAGEFPKGDARLVERMSAAMVVEYLVMVNADPSYDRDAELLERLRRFIG